jgi:hypothetical protein
MPVIKLPAEFGEPMLGGFFAGLINVSDQVYGLIVAPKAQGETEAVWHPDWAPVPGATSTFDGLQNTLAMAEANSPAAKWALGLSINSHTDWYLPSRDELEVIYRNLKPTDDDNYTHGRHGENLSAVPPTRLYEVHTPGKTNASAFHADGAEAFEPICYLSSTQYSPDYAWVQDFSDGLQNYFDKDFELRARVVRRFKVE